MWDFDHAPHAAALAERYELHSTTPALCAEELLSGRADLGLIPIASLTPDLAIVPGCAIASLDRVRSIQLIIKIKPGPIRRPHTRLPATSEGLAATQTRQTATVEHALSTVRTIAADTASRSSLVYAQLLFRKFLGTDPEFVPVSADPFTMLASADAALLIGDPALLALENRDRIEAVAGPCLWLDLAHEWHTRTGMPWVAAVWAVRPDSLARASIRASELIADLTASRDRGLANIDTLVNEWSLRIAVPPETIRDYMARNIHYILSDDCTAAIRHFRALAAEASLLPPLGDLNFLAP